MGEAIGLGAFKLSVQTGLANQTHFNAGKTDGTNATENALKNASGAANGGKETASLVLRGYPLLKAKTTLEITGVGKGSGIWYCKTVIHQWDVNHGYLTNAQLMKGEGGDGGGDTPGDSVPPPTKKV
jgi:phage protein D